MAMLQEKVLTTLRDQLQVPRDARLVLAVSGGADSLALLEILRLIAPTLGWQLTAATLDHQLRGEAGAADVQFVVHTGRAWGIPVIAGQANVQQLAAQWGIGIEAAARRARYDFLASAARQVGAQYVLTAHHADDQAETVLMHLLRGAGAQGLSGMRLIAPLPDHPDLTLLRPLLWVSRAEIDLYCADHSLNPRQDDTNADTVYLRNRLRHETLPALKVINPQIVSALGQLAEILATESDYLDQQIEYHIAQGVRIVDGYVEIKRLVYQQAHPALRRRLLIWAAAQLGVTERSFAAVIAAEQFAITAQVGSSMPLAGGLDVYVDYAVLRVGTGAAVRSVPKHVPWMPSNVEIFVKIFGETIIPEANGILCAYENSSHLERLHPSITLAIPEKSEVLVRTRRAGDRWQPLGLNGHQKIKKWMIDHKLPQAQRDYIPMLIVDGQIAAVFHSGDQSAIADDFAVKTNSTRTVTFYWRFNSVK